MLVMMSMFGQDTVHAKVVKDRNYYESKGTEQLVVGGIFFVSGVTVLVVASAGNVDLDVLPVLVIGGAAASIAGVALLISSVKSKKKAKTMDAYFRMETAPIVRHRSFGHQYFPALTLDIRL